MHCIKKLQEIGNNCEKKGYSVPKIRVCNLTPNQGHFRISCTFIPCQYYEDREQKCANQYRGSAAQEMLYVKAIRTTGGNPPWVEK